MVQKKSSKVTKNKIVKISPEVIVNGSKSEVRSFLEFIRTQGVVGLAVGLVLGGAISVMVKSFIDNVIMPPIGLLLGSTQGLKGLEWVMSKTVDGQPVVLHYGVFLNDFTNFVVIALVVYIAVHLLKADQFDKKKQ